MPPPRAPGLALMASKMEKEQSHVTERILNLTLEIIYLLTGEDYAVVKTSGEPSAPGVLSSDLRRKRKINERKILKVTSQIIDLLAEEDWENGEENKDPSKMADCETQTPPDWSSIKGSSKRRLRQEDQEIPHQGQGGDAGFIKVEYVGGEEDTYAEPTFITQDGQYSQSSADAPPVLSSPLKTEGEGSRQHFPAEGAINTDLQPGLSGPESSSKLQSSKIDCLVDSFAMRKQSPNNSKIYPCTECGQCFTSMWHCSRHMKLHRGEKPFSCNQCGKRFARKHHVSVHERSHSSEKPFSCSLCGKFFKHKSHLVTHTRIHTGEKPFICVECGKCFTQKANLLYHQKTHACGKLTPVGDSSLPPQTKSLVI